MTNFDVIVAGLGAMGSATLYQLSKTNLSILGIDRFNPPHDRGSSHGETRITRLAVGEGEAYYPLVAESHKIWREIEELTGLNLLHQIGCLIFTEGQEKSFLHGDNFWDETIRIANKYGIKHEMYDFDSLCKQYPQIKFNENAYGYFEFEAGYLIPEKCIESNLMLAGKFGANLAVDEQIIKLEYKDTIRVQTNKNVYECAKLILTLGSWIKQFPEFQNIFKVFRQVMYWFDVEIPEQQYTRGNLPVFIRAGEDAINSYYGFPIIYPKQGMKIGIEQYELESNPDFVNTNISEEETRIAYELFSKNFQIKPRCLHSKTCLYTVTPDYGFVIDYHPESNDVLVASPCSGHGFKHSAGIGKLLAQLVTDDELLLDPTPFRLDRF